MNEKDTQGTISPEKSRESPGDIHKNTSSQFSKKSSFWKLKFSRRKRSGHKKNGTSKDLKERPAKETNTPSGDKKKSFWKMDLSRKRGGNKIRGKLKIEEKIDLARHLAMVIKAGLPLYEGLSIIQGQKNSPTMIAVLKKIRGDVNSGKFLADSLDGLGHVFGNFFINIIRVGESSGTLSQNLAYLAEELKKAKALKQKVKSAMIYPIIILFATIGLTIFLAFFVFPKLLPVIEGLNVELPGPTKVLITSIDFIQSYGILLIAGIVLLSFISRITLNKIPSVKYIWHRILFSIPTLGPLIIGVNIASFTRVLGLLLKSGIKIVTALNITSDTFTNMVYKKYLSMAADEVQKGGKISTIFTEEKKIFSPILAGMVDVGESTGSLEENLFYLSEYYEEEIDGKLQNLTALLEPILLLFMGLMVGFVAISIILPIYSLSQGVNQ